MALELYRLSLEDPESWPEPIGEGVQRVGAVVVPGGRTGTTISAGLNSFSGADVQTAADRERVRRQFRSLVGNLPARIRGYWIAWTEDPEQDGWYVPGGATMELAGQGALASAFWKFAGVELALVGRPRTHRRGADVETWNMRTGTVPRDHKRTVYSTDFGTMADLVLAWLPSSIEDPVVTAGASARLTAAQNGYGGSQIQAVVGVAHGSHVSFEQAPGYRHRGDVVVYDRRGTITAPTTGPAAAWEEVYGPDWPWYDLEADAPVLDNSLARVRWDELSGTTPGLIVDRWSGSAWVEQGKILIERNGDLSGFCDDLVSAVLIESSPERAVLKLIVRDLSDPYSRDEVFVTLCRGWTGPRVELYPAPVAAGTKAGGAIYFVSATITGTATAVKKDSSSTAAVAESSGFGAVAVLGAATFTGENWITLVPDDDGAAVTLAVVDASSVGYAGLESTAYGASRKTIRVYHAAPVGYVSAHVGFGAALTGQSLEAESMTLAAGTSSTADGTAVGGTAASATRTAEADHVTQASFLTSAPGTYRILVRVRNGSAGTLNVKARVNGVDAGGGTRTTTSTTYTWVDCGEVAVGTGTLAVRAWRSSAGTFYVDRVLALKTSGADATVGLYDGAQDHGRQALRITNTPQRIVPR